MQCPDNFKSTPPLASVESRRSAVVYTLTVTRIATQVYRHVLRPDSHRLRELTLHGTLSKMSPRPGANRGDESARQ